MFNFQAKEGSFSAVALNSAARRYTSVMPCLSMIRSMPRRSMASTITNGPVCSTWGSFMSEATTFSAPKRSRRPSTSSVPIWPLEPMTRMRLVDMEL